MTPPLAAASLAQALTFALLGWATGGWLIAKVDRARDERAEKSAFGWPERLLMGAAGGVLASVALMVANLVLGGVVFGIPGVVPVLALALVLLRRRSLADLRAIPWRAIAVFVLLAGVLWGLPTLLSGTAARTGDIPWHLGWTEQLLAGEPVPEGPAPAAVAENAYPWGFHAVLATLVRLVPGSNVLSALIAMQLLLVAWIPLAAACIARRVAPDAGWGAAAATAFIGGFGWLLALEPAFVTSPPRARFGADLVVASPNAVYGLFPPPLPRELGLVMLGAAGVLLAGALRRERDDLLVRCGITLGCAGLVSVPALVAGVAWIVAVVLVVRRYRGWSVPARVLLPALGVFALWAAPVLRGMLVYGGLVNVSPSLGREWPLGTALGSWGLLVPLVLIGAFAARSLRGVRVLAAFALATAVLLGLAVARGRFDWSLAGNATVLHQGRMWPVAHLLAGAAGGVGLWFVAGRLEAWRRFAGRLGAAGIVLVGAASPMLASVALTRTVIDERAGYVYASDDLDEDSFARRAAARLDPDDIVLVRGGSREANALAFHLFSFSGVRLAEYDDLRLERNDLRIRFVDLAAQWEERSAAGDFDVDYEVAPLPPAREDGALPANGLQGDFAGRTWVLTPSDD